MFTAGGVSMPKTKSSGRVKESELPATLKRSPKKAQRTYAKTHDRAVEQYGEGERAHRTAMASLKHSFEKVGDHWEPKKRRGPSDPRSKKTTAQKQQGKGETFGGVDAEGNTKRELYDRAKRLGIEGRSKMSKNELARAIAKKQ
jgi:cation transport regulator ChaB